jgi:NhaP-type Na+/H+ or K+/H+ antiporter
MIAIADLPVGGLDTPSIEANLRQFCLVLSVSLGVATLSRVFSLLRNIPYTLLLLLVGLGLAVLDVRLINLSPELILFIFLPPLLFEAAWNLSWKNLKQYAVPISLYAIVGVIICVGSLVVGLQVWAGASLATALLVGASLSATDPVSVALALSVPALLSQRQEVISIVFGVMLFTLLVQGLTTQPLLQWLGLLGDQPLRLEYKQLTARRVALNRVMDRLVEIKATGEFDQEFVSYQMALVDGQMDQVQEQITQLEQHNPLIQELASERLREQLLAIEADTYAEFIRTGHLKDALDPLLASALLDKETA